MDHRRAADGDVPSDARAAGDADAACHRAVRADAHVVTDLHLVVELDPLLDHRVVERAAVDSGIRANLDVVADAHPADLWNFYPAAFLGGDAEAVGADDRAGMDHHALAEHALRIKHDARIKARVVADGDVLADQQPAPIDTFLPIFALGAITAEG